MIEIVRPGLLTTVQDLGRPGYAHLGVARSGALDAPSLIRANHLVGNPDGAAALETTLTGVTLRAESPTVVAVCGAVAPVTVNGAPVSFDAAVAVPAGAVIDVGAAVGGVRSYVAFAGGVSVAPVLGSRSTDTLSGLGPPPLRTGFAFPLGRPLIDIAPPRSTSTGSAPCPALLLSQPRDAPARASGNPDNASEPPADTPDVLLLRLRLGPRHDWLSVPARDALLEKQFSLSVKTNRVGARLVGPTLTRSIAGELPSEGIVLGAVQVPPDGQPLIFLADHPTTGGYPVIGVVDTPDLAPLAQARPGAAIRFVPWT